MLRVREAEFEILKAKLSHVGVMNCTVATASMSPLIPAGATVEIQSVARPLRRFDIVVFWKAQGTCLVCHYLWHINVLPSDSGGRTLVTRALTGGEDLPIDEARILGLVTNFRISRGRRLRLLLRAIWKRAG